MAAGALQAGGLFLCIRGAPEMLYEMVGVDVRGANESMYVGIYARPRPMDLSKPASPFASVNLWALWCVLH
jgi:hypothetical protein